MTATPESADERIDAALRRRGVADHLIGVGLDGLIDRWETVVSGVARGDTGGLDEYLNDLDLRDIIGDVVTAVAESRGPLLARLRDVDARFRAVTTAVPDNLWGSSASGDPHRTWWYYRVPVTPSPDLQNDLVARG